VTDVEFEEREIMSSVQSQLRELSLLVRDHKMYSRQRTVPVRRAFNRVYKLFRLPTYLRRRRLVDSIPNRPDFTIPEEQGFVLWQPKDFPLLDSAIAEAKAVFDKADLPAIKKTIAADKSFAGVPFELTPDSAIVRLATDSRLLKPLAQYLGGVPILQYVQLMYSPNDRKAENSAQAFHLDGQDVRSLQIFVYLDDVTEDNGPVTVVNAAASERLARTLRYRKTPTTKRVDDETVKRIVGDGNLQVMTGKAGSVCIFDGDRCFHFGSRKATKPRRILQYEYVSPFAFVLPKRWWEGLRYTHLGKSDAPAWARSVLQRN
jgi:hypothetical protein